jgi:integrase
MGHRLLALMLKHGHRRTKADTGLSARTVTKTLTVLTTALEDALREGAITRNVAALVVRPTYIPPEMSTWTEGDVASFLKEVQDDFNYVAWLLALYGLRRGEVLGLRWSDVDFEAKVIIIRWSRTSPDGVKVVEGEPKTRKGFRTLPMDDTLHKALWALWESDAPCKPLHDLFRASRGPGPVW